MSGAVDLRAATAADVREGGTLAIGATFDGSPAECERRFQEVLTGFGLKPAPRVPATLGTVAGRSVGGADADDVRQESGAVPSVCWLGETVLLRRERGRSYVLACLSYPALTLRMIATLKRELKPFGLGLRLYPRAGWLPGYPLILIARKSVLAALPAVRGPVEVPAPQPAQVVEPEPDPGVVRVGSPSPISVFVGSRQVVILGSRLCAGSVVMGD